MAKIDEEQRGPNEGAVFGFYPQMADNRHTLVATGNKLRQGVQGLNGGTFEPASPAPTPIPASPTSLTRMDASTDPRSFIAGTPAAPASVPALDTTKPALPGAPSAGGAIADSSTTTDVQRGGGNVPGIAPSPVGGAPGAFKTTANGSTLYSDGNATADTALMARSVPTAGAMAAADNLAARNDGTQAALGARFAQEVRGARAANAAGAANAQRVENDMEREKLLKFATTTPSRSRAAGAIGLLANSAATQANERVAEAQLGFRGQELAQTTATAAARNQVDQARLGLDTRKAGLDANAQQQLLAAQQAVTGATTPEARSTAEDNLRALQGRYEKTIPNRFTVVPGGKDERGDTLPSQVLNNQTGEFVQPPGAKPAAALPPKDQLVAGQTYTTAKGAAVWDGSKFTPK